MYNMPEFLKEKNRDRQMPVPMLRLNFSYEVWISVLIVGRETAANLWFSVGSEVVGRVRGVRNPVHVW